MDIHARQVRAHDPIWHRSIANTDMGYLPLGKGRTILGARDELPGVVAKDVRFR